MKFSSIGNFRFNTNETKNLFLIKKFKRPILLTKRNLKLQKVFKKGHWTKDEHLRFVRACIFYGKDWKKVN